MSEAEHRKRSPMRQAFDLANVFLAASRRCMEARPRPGNSLEILPGAAVVCAAHSVEVALKGLLLGTGAPTKKGHDLMGLFGKLPAETQSRIVGRVGLPRKHFDPILDSVRTAHILWRYIYEQRTAQVNIEFLMRLADAILAEAPTNETA